MPPSYEGHLKVRIHCQLNLLTYNQSAKISLVHLFVFQDEDVALEDDCCGGGASCGDNNPMIG